MVFIEEEKNKGKYFAKIYPIVFWLLATNSFLFYLIPKDPIHTQPYLYIPICFALILLILPIFFEIPLGILNDIPGWAQILWLILIIWAVVITFHNFEFSIDAIRYVFGSEFGAGTWFAPFAMVAGTQTLFWKRIIKHFEIHTIIGLILGIIYAASLIPGYKIVTNINGTIPKFIVPRYEIIDLGSVISFLYASGFLFLCIPIPYGKKRLIPLGGVLFLFIYKGFLLVSRNVMFKNMNYIFFFFIHWLFKRKERFVFQKFLIIYFGIFFICLTSWCIFHGNVPSFLKKPTIYFREKLFKNTRKGLFEVFFKQVSESKVDLLIGKGSWGKWGYYKNVHKGRLHIENGYTYILLKGGIITLLPFLILSWSSVFLGIKANNWFIRSCALYVLGRLLDMFPYGLPMFEGNYLIFWLCVGACLKKEFREMSEFNLK